MDNLFNQEEELELGEEEEEEEIPSPIPLTQVSQDEVFPQRGAQLYGDDSASGLGMQQDVSLTPSQSAPPAPTTSQTIKTVVDEILKTEEFKDLPVDEAIGVMLEYVSPEDFEDKEVLDLLAEKTEQMRRAKGIPPITEEEIMEIGEGLGVEDPKINPEASKEEKEALIIDYGAQLRYAAKERLGDEYLLYKNEIERAIDKATDRGIREYAGAKGRAETLPGKVVEGAIRLTTGAVQEMGEMTSNESLKTFGRTFTDPSVDGETWAQVMGGLGQAATQIGVRAGGIAAGTVIGGAIGNVPGAIAGAKIGGGITGAAIFSNLTWRGVKESYNEAFEKTADREQALQSAVERLPYATLENSVDFLLQGRWGRMIATKIVGKPVANITKLSRPLQEAVLKEAIKHGVKGLTAAEKVARWGKVASPILKEAALGAGTEYVSEGIGATGEEVVRKRIDTKFQQQAGEDVEVPSYLGAVPAVFEDPEAKARIKQQAKVGGIVGMVAGAAVGSVSGPTRKYSPDEWTDEEGPPPPPPEMETEPIAEGVSPPIEPEVEPEIESPTEKVTTAEPEIGPEIEPESEIKSEEKTTAVEPEISEPVRDTETGEEIAPSAPDKLIQEGKLTPEELAKPRAYRSLTGKRLPYELKYIPLDQLVVQKDPNLRQWKIGADPDTGVVGIEEMPKQMEFSQLQAGAIVAIQKKNGEIEVVTGRNRLEMAKRDPDVNEILVAVMKEGGDVTVQEARMLDVEMNIRDGKGDVLEFAKFFEVAKIPPDVALRRGLIGKRRNPAGNEGYAVGVYASPNVKSAAFSETIDSRSAAMIALAAPMPNGEGLQQIGLDALNEGFEPEMAVSEMRLTQRQEEMVKEKSLAGKETQTEIFGSSGIIQSRAGRRALALAARALYREKTRTLARIREKKRLAELTPEEKKELEAGFTGELGITEQELIQRKIAQLGREVTYLHPKKHDAWMDDPDLVKQVEAKADEMRGGQQDMFEEKREIPKPSVGSDKQGRFLNIAEIGARTREEFYARREPEAEEREAAVSSREPGVKEPIHKFKLPGLVKLTKELIGSVPGMKDFRGPIYGKFSERLRRVLLLKELPRDPVLLGDTLAHEIGHVIDVAKEISGKGSNVLGKFLPLSDFKKNTFGETKKTKSLLPKQEIEHGGDTFAISIAGGKIYAFSRPTEVASGEKVKARKIPLSAVPQEVWSQYMQRLNPMQKQLFDAVKNHKAGLRPLTEDFGLDKDSGLILANPVLAQQAWDLSQKWRPISPYAGPRHLAYRASANELYADFISAVLNNSKWVSEQYPQLFKAFQQSIKGKPDVQKALVEINDLLGNPEEFTDLLAFEARTQAEKLPDIMKKKIEEQKEADKNLLLRAAKRGYAALKEAPRILMESRIPIEKAAQAELNKVKKEFATKLDALDTWTAQLAKEGLKDPEIRQTLGNRIAELKKELEDLKTTIYEREDEIHAYRSVPVRQFMYLQDMRGVEETLRNANVDFQSFHIYKMANRIIGETTSTLEYVKDNPEETKKAIGWIVDNAELFGMDLRRFASIPDSDLEGQALADAIAPLELEFSVQDKKGKRRAKLIKEAEKIEDPVVFDILNEHFNVRRYLANPDGWTVEEAQNQIDKLRKDLGPEAFNQMLEADKVFAKRNWEVVQEAHRAGLIGPKLFKQMRLNKDNYVNFTVLHHFADNPKFDGRIRQQFGTFDSIGNTYVSTLAKTKELVARAVKQHAVNEGIAFAKEFDEINGLNRVRMVTDPQGRPYTYLPALFQRYDKIRLAQQRGDSIERTKSYLLEYADGKPILWEIDDDGALQSMFYRKRSVDYSRMFGAIQAWQGVQKALYTVYSPVFTYFTNPPRDRLKEARMASRILPRFNFLYWHLSPDLRGKSKVATQIAQALYDYGTGKTYQLPENMPFKKEIEYMLRTGYLGIPIGDPTVHPTAMVEPVQIDAETSIGANSASDLVAAFGIPSNPNRYIQSARDLTALVKNERANKAMSMAVDVMAKKAQIDELKTKITGFLIEKERSDFGDAIRRADLLYGSPSPTGGGTHNAVGEAMFLFWRVSAYTPRAIKQIATKEPMTAAGIAARQMIGMSWKIPAFSFPIAYLLTKAVGGDDEDAERMKKLLDVTAKKMSRYEKSTYGAFPLGFYNPMTKDYTFWWNADPDVVSSPEWKEIHIRIAQDPDARLISRYLYSLLERTAGTPSKRTLTGQFLKDTWAEAPDVVPAIGTLRQGFEILAGDNPSDSFYERGVLPRELEKGGSLMEKLAFFGHFAVSKHIPLAPRPKMSAKELDMFEKFFRVPGFSAVFGMSNYGEVESSLNEKAIADHERTARRKDYPDTIKKMLTDYTFLRDVIGKDKRTPRQEQEYIALGNWKFGVYDYYDNEIGNANEMGEEKQIKQLLEWFEKDTVSNQSMWEAYRVRRRTQKKMAKKRASVVTQGEEFGSRDIQSR